MSRRKQFTILFFHLSSSLQPLPLVSCDLIAALLLRLTVASQIWASETWFVTGIIDNLAVLSQREEEKISEQRLKLSSFLHCWKQFVVLVICKYPLYISKKYSIDFDFFKCMCFVLSFQPRLSTFFQYLKKNYLAVV